MYSSNSLKRDQIPYSQVHGRLSRKIDKFTKKSSSLLNATNHLTFASNNCDQHSDLKWLEKVVYDMRRYQNGSYLMEAENKKKKEERQEGEGQNGLRERDGNLEKRVIGESKKEKGNCVQESVTKSGKKIKFQVIANKQNKVPSARKTEQNHKSIDKNPKKGNKKVSTLVSSSTKVTPNHKTVPSNQSSNVKLSKPQNKQVILDPCLTQDLSRVNFKQSVQNLWEDSYQKQILQRGLNRSCQDVRKSAGKIIKNNNKTTPSNQTSLASILIEQKQQRPVTSALGSKMQHKVYIKLQTGNLSQYLNDKNSQKMDQLLQTEQYKKCCPSSREQPKASRVKPFQPLKTRHYQLPAKYQASHQKYLTEKKYKNIDGSVKKQPREVKAVVRAKSQQRKLNKLAVQILDNKMENETKSIGDLQIGQSATFPQRSSIKQKFFKLQLKKTQIQDKVEQNCQKIFTLNSKNEKQQQKFEPQNRSLSGLQSQIQQNFTTYHSVQHQQPDLKSIFLPKREIEITSQTQFFPNMFQVDQSKSPYEKQLGQLFNFLDEGKRGLLTGSNCQVDALTQELKFMFSCIFNQIKTKKRAYDLQRFIKESTAILEVKKEVYNANSATAKDDIIFEILRENLQILLKRSPLQFVKHTYTESYFPTNQHTSRQSLAQQQSIVISKMIPQVEVSTCQAPPQKKFNYFIRSQTTPVNYEEPELFLQQKYGIVGLRADRAEEEDCGYVWRERSTKNQM